jgi:lipopolysaccharide export system permease protein
MKILDRYILRAHVGPFLFAFFTTMFVLILSFLTRFVDRFVGKGLDFAVIIEMILLQSAWMVGLAAPMAVLVAVVMAFGALTNSSEMTVMKAGGISLYRMILPVLFCGLLLSLLVERFNNVLLPEANYQAKALLSDITRTKPSFGLTENSFSDVISGYSIFVRKTDARTQELEGVIIYDRSRPSYKTVVTAARGSVGFTSDSHYLVMTLYDGEIHELRFPEMKKYRKMQFGKHRFVFESTGYGFERTDETSMRRGDRELSSSELKAIGEELQARMHSFEQQIRRPLEALRLQIEKAGKHGGGKGVASAEKSRSARTDMAIAYTDRLLASLSGEIAALDLNRKMYNMYMVEYYKKYAISFACTVFVLVGAPLGVLARRGGFGVGAGLSLVFFVVYWVMMIAGEKLSDRGLLQPALSVWLPDLVLMVFGLFMLARLTASVSGSSR